MKKQLITLILTTLVTSLRVYSQDFGKVGTEWFYNENGGGAATGQEYVHLESVKDTIINGKTTHKITWSYYRFYGDTLHYDPFYVYEESDTVYRWSFNESRFLRLFIFNGNQGDTLILHKPDNLTFTDSTYRLVIDTVEQFSVDGIVLNRYRVNSIDDYIFWNGGYFMDRIGGLDWFVPRGTIFPEAGGPIRCYSDNDLDTTFTSIACDYLLINSIDEINKNPIRIHPNPTTDLVYIESESIISRVEVLGVNGQRLLFNDSRELDLSGLKDGFYLLKISAIDGTTVNEKIIKNAR